MREYSQEEHDAVDRTMKDFFRQVASRFEHAAFRDDLPGPSGQPGGIIELSCSLPGTARIAALVGADQIDLYVGRQSWREFLPARKDRDSARMIDSVRKAVEDVVAGRFRERVGFRVVRYSAYG